MNRAKFIVLTGALALIVGCASNKTNKQASAEWKSDTQTSETTTTASNTPTTKPSAEAEKWVGAWQLACPRQEQQAAAITADGSTIVIEAGENLSGTYVVQGNYLLAWTRDERLRTVAWRINSDDSITVVRGPNGGSEFNGVTMVRAAETVAAKEMAEETDTTANADEFQPAQTDAEAQTDAGEIDQ